MAFGLVEILLLPLQSFWLMLPAMAAGPGAVFGGGGRRIDGGRTWRDGRPLLGKGKTVNGLAWGLLVGTAVGSVQGILMVAAGGASPYTFLPPQATLLGIFGVVFPLALGAMCGDLLGAFLKRRMGYARGAPAPLLDQYDFAIGAWAFLLIFNPAFFVAAFSLERIATLLILIPLLHRLTNVIGYRWGKKREPW